MVGVKDDSKCGNGLLELDHIGNDGSTSVDNIDPVGTVIKIMKR